MARTDDEWISGAEAARRIGITAQSLGVWGARSDAPTRTRSGTRQYRWPAFPRWREEQLLQTARAGKRMDRSEADERKAAAEAELAELKLARERRDVVPAADVQAAAEAEATHVGAVLDSTSTEMAPWLAARLSIGLREASAVLREITTNQRARLAAADDTEQESAA